MKYRAAAIVMVALSLQSKVIDAAITVDIPRVCPIGGEKFKTNERAAIYTEGRNLDLKPYGDFEGVWPPLPVCPRNGFVMFRKDFTSAELKKLKSFIATDEYAKWRTNETPYYIAAKLAGFLGESDDLVANRYLQASWSAKTPDQYQRYARETLDSITALLAKLANDKSQDWVRFQILAGELERRLSLFSESINRFETLQKDDLFKSGFMASIAALEISLAKKKDNSEQKLPKS